MKVKAQKGGDTSTLDFGDAPVEEAMSYFRMKGFQIVEIDGEPVEGLCENCDVLVFKSEDFNRESDGTVRHQDCGRVGGCEEGP